MSWTAKGGDPEAIQESVAGDGVWSTFRNVVFGGGHDLIIERTDAAATSDNWAIWIFAAHSTSLVSGKSYKGPFYLESTDLKKHISVYEIMGYKVFIANVDDTKVDLIGVDIYTREGALS